MRTFVASSVASILFLTVGAQTFAAPSLRAELRRERPRGAPGPIAAAGLPFLLAAGALMVLRRRRKR